MRRLNDRGVFLGATVTDLIVTWLIASAFFLLADWRRQHTHPSLWLHPDLSTQIGAEYDTIATSIREGRGFSDPFREPSGPTAWMPPVLVYITAGLYWMTGDDRQAVVEIIVMINLMVILFAATIVTGTARKLGIAWVGYLLLIVGLAADFFELYQRTHDTWLILLMLCLVWVGVQRHASRSLRRWRHVAGTATFQSSSRGQRNLRRLRWPILWGVFGGLCALSSPVVGFTWAALTTLEWFPWRILRGSTHRRVGLYRMLPLVTAAIMSIITVSPWMIRNRVVMGAWIPVKSNAMYEIWQSQVLDDDGVLDSSSAFQHPWGSRSAQRLRYLEVGELEFIAERRAPVMESIRENPFELVKRVTNRWIAACLYYRPLVANDEQMIGRMRLLRLYFPIPFLSLLCLVCFRRGRWDSELRAAIAIYVLYLMPYIAISYYDRYAAPAFVFKLLIVLYAIDTLLRFARERFAGESQQVETQL